jgi:hypothetical protein
MEQQLQCLDDFQAPKSVWAELKASGLMHAQAPAERGV